MTAELPIPLPGDVQRILSFDELPPRVRRIPANHNPLATGVLMDPQREWIRMCHEYDLMIAEKGRRTGITYATALDSTIIAASSADAGGDNVYYIGDTKEKGLEFIGYCAHMAKTMAAAMADGFMGIEVFLFEDQQDDGSSRQITSYRIRFASGFQIVALSSNPANIRGLQGIVIIDEAAFHKNVQAVVDACNALLIWGGKIRVISTHNGDRNPFNQLIRDAHAGINPFQVFRCTFDDAVAAGLFERVCMMRKWEPTEERKRTWYNRIRGSYGANKDAMAEELDAIAREGSGIAIPGVVIESCMREARPIARLTLDTAFGLRPVEERDAWCADWIVSNIDPLLAALDPELHHSFGFDYARHMDFACFGPIETKQDLTRYVPWILEMHNVPKRQQQQVLFHIIRRLPRFTCGAMDATGNGAGIAEDTADEFGQDRIHQIKLNDAWYRDNMGSFVQGFEDRVLDIPRDADVKNDLRSLARINGIIKLTSLRVADTKDSEKKRHGDAAIMLALGWFAANQDTGPPAAALPQETKPNYHAERKGRFFGGIGRMFSRRAA